MVLTPEEVKEAHPLGSDLPFSHTTRGKPFAIEPAGDGELWSWKSWLALIVNDRVQEIWIADTGDAEADRRAAR